MRHYLSELRPYFRQTAGELILGSIAGIVMNTAVVLPAILLGRAIDTALALERGQASASAVGWAALAFIGGTLLSEGPRILKRWWLMTANARIRANVRADAVRGLLALPLAEMHQTPIGDLMAQRGPRQLVSINPAATVAAAIERMEKAGIDQVA